MKEIAYQFGENRRLSGIMTYSDTPRDTTLVFLSAGLDTKHGPFRIYAQIARMAARHHFNSFRFDYGDLGYSQPEKSTNLLKVRNTIEIKAALDFVQSVSNNKQFLLIGLCSGAEDAFSFAALDPRVKGIIMIDTFTYKTPQYNLYEFFNRLKRWSLRKMHFLLKTGSIRSENKIEPDVNLIDYNYMEYNEVTGILNELIQKNLKLHFIYTSGSSFNHKAQLRKMFPELKNYHGVVLDYLPSIGHTQLLEEERVVLLNVIEKRLATFF